MKDKHLEKSLHVKDLAKYRTMLANERTLLSYLRTAIMLAVSGVTLLKLLSAELHFLILGLFLIPLSILVAVFGYVRFRTIRKEIADT